MHTEPLYADRMAALVCSLFWFVNFVVVVVVLKGGPRTPLDPPLVSIVSNSSTESPMNVPIIYKTKV